MRIKLSGIVDESIVDGLGYRCAVFFQGCEHNCPGCHNPQTHDLNGGYYSDTDKIIAEAAANPILDGITLTGGEPFLQPEAACDLAIKAHQSGLNVWAYTGYTYEQILKEYPSVLKEIDVLADGVFIKAQRTLDKPFVGSRNQRVIDVKKSLSVGEPVLLEL